MSKNVFSKKVFSKYKRFKNRTSKTKIVVLSLVLILLANFVVSYTTGINVIGTGIKKVFNSVGIYTEEKKQVEIESSGYTSQSGGSWHIDKSADWTDLNKGQVTFELNTVVKTGDHLKDVIFVLDISGSMSGTKLEKVKEDTIELINYLLSNNKNRVALITFDSTSTILSEFTNDKEKLIQLVSGLKDTGCTNYHAGLLNVEKVLEGYERVENKDLVTLFLTDGYPNEDTPNQVGEYRILKDKYPYITINGVQYEMGSKIIQDIIDITDEQFVADVDNLNNVLFEASIAPEYYDNFEITDFVDKEHWEVIKESDIKVNKGTVRLIEENGVQKIIWTFESGKFRTGDSAKMTFDVSLKEKYAGTEGFYPTNEKETIKSKLPEEDEKETTSDKTPVLKNNYDVIYDTNLPKECGDSTRTSEIHFIYENVTKKNPEVSCDNYSFKGWEIVDEDIKKINDDVFIMPSHDVEIKAVWTKASIKKSVEGTVNEKLTLYKQLKVDYENNNHAKKYSGATDTFNGNQDVYYYYGNTPNNNVIFGGFCWRMYRTTDTGGVKMVYNGEPDSEGKCGTDRGNHVGYGSKTSQSLSSNYNYGTDYTYDEVSKTFTLAGNIEQATWNSTTYPSLIGKYTCRNTTGSCSTLYYVESYYSNSSAYALPLNSTTNYSFIGSSVFNSSSSSPADVGYMYNKRYTYNSKSMTSTTSILSSSSLGTSYYYADNAVWGTPTANRFNLENPYKVADTTEYPNLVGKYTFRNSSETYTNSNVYYITNVNNTTMYYISLSSSTPDLASANTSYYFADFLIDDGTGKQILDPSTTKEVKRTEWYDSYADYKNKFYCPAPDCTTVYYVTSTSNTSMTHVNIANDYIYGNSFTYDKDTGMYTLSGETQHFYDWPNNNSKLGNTHYTCWNTSGTCQKLSYIYYISSGTPYYIDLENGTSVEKALDEMLHNESVNATNSTIKTVIDAWYSKNMTQYTDYFEDTVWCNSRREANLNGWNPNGGKVSGDLDFWSYTNGSNLTCPDKIDRFTVNEENGNGALTYPVGLVTRPEQGLAYSSSNSPLSSGGYNWTLSPNYFNYYNARGYYVSSHGNYSTRYVDNANGVRPAVSLRAGIEYSEGDGTVDTPYIIDMES